MASSTEVAASAVEYFDMKAEIAHLLPDLRAFSRSLAGSPDLADDIVQDSVLKAWKARDRPTTLKYLLDEAVMVRARQARDKLPFTPPEELFRQARAVGGVARRAARASLRDDGRFGRQRDPTRGVLKPVRDPPPPLRARRPPLAR